MATVFDAETPAEQAYWNEILISQYGDPKRIKWTSPEDPPTDEGPSTKAVREGVSAAKDVFAAIHEKTQAQESADASNR